LPHVHRRSGPAAVHIWVGDPLKFRAEANRLAGIDGSPHDPDDWCSREVDGVDAGEDECLSSTSKRSNTNRARPPKMIRRKMYGTSVPLKPRWCKFNVTTDNPDANETKQIETP
jgi:hypothetical protein